MTRDPRSASEGGFTLIELLVVVAVIAILSSIALARFAHAQRKSVDAVVQNDLRNAANAMEGFHQENDLSYVGASIGDLVDVGFRRSEGVVLFLLPLPNRYLVLGYRPGGSGLWWYDSDSGQLKVLFF